jgi:dihydroorotase-like cyclic amidohydrolase
VRRAAELAESCGADLHIVHISTGRGAELAVQHGASVETCVHYLAFSLADFEKRGSVLKTAPVLKRDERGFLWEKLREGIISFVTSDHAASSAEEKQSGSIWRDYAGIAGSGLLLPYMFCEGYLKKRIGLQRLLEVISENPARRYKLDGHKGRIAVGMDADLVLIDASEEYEIRGKDFLSKGKITPFEGQKFRGKIKKTLVRGRVVYDHEKGILEKGGYGEFL